MKKPFKKTIYTLSILGCLFLLKKFCDCKTDGFSVLSVMPNRAFDPSNQTRAILEEEENLAKSALDQPYYYGGFGAQTFIFFSADGKYALKLFKQRIYNTPVWFKVPIPFVLSKYKSRLTAHRKDKYTRDFASYKLSFNDLRNITGVLYVHLNPTNHLKKNLTIFDKMGRSHEIPLDKLDFVLQRKAELVHERIDRLMKENKQQEAKQAIDSVVDLIITRCSMGLQDRDPSIDTNCGFVDEKAIKIDVGRLCYNESFTKTDIIISELEKITKPFNKWLKDKYPSLCNHLEQSINSKETKLSNTTKREL